MEVFTDYQCPSCRNLYENTLRPMINDYVASGKVYLVHHDFPLPMHKYGYEAARWLNASARVGEFASVEAALYDNQDAWGADGNIEKYVSAAMSAAQFKRVQKLMDGPCLVPIPAGSGGNHACPFDAYIEEDRAIGMRIPVQATPTYVISYKGQHLPPASGFVSWPILKQFFDSLLSQ
jgi:protein-disulfide isomerase